MNDCSDDNFLRIDTSKTVCNKPGKEDGGPAQLCDHCGLPLGADDALVLLRPQVAVELFYFAWSIAHNNFEPVATPASRSISSLAYHLPQNLPPQHSALTGAAFDKQPAVISHCYDQDYEQLSTQQQNGTTPSTISLNIEPEDLVELNWLLANIGTNSPNDQSEFAEQYEQQLPVGNGPSVNPLFNPDRSDSNMQTWEFVNRFIEESKIDSQNIIGDETIFNEDVSSDMGSITTSVPFTSQTETGTPMSNASVEEMVDSPMTSSRSSSAFQRGVPYSLYRERRDRNNEASRRSREKRKAKHEQNKKELKELELQNECLHAEVARLEAIVNEWEVVLSMNS
uniref:BZIP domain-containing protein n=1 Tax=Plectus sambesii TaxID=2011161 RepID=A0A914W8H5_9BILA